MHSILTKPVFYLRIQDFDHEGNLKNPIFKNKLVITFIHADFCSYCLQAKPEFQKAALENKNKNIIFTAIQIDGEDPGEKKCYNILDKILSNYQGFPDYAIFFNSKPTFETISNRDSNSIISDLKKIFVYNQK